MTLPEVPVILWFRNDLRVADNPALLAAAAQGGPVIPLFILDDAAAGMWALGGAARWWLHHSLTALSADLKAHYGLDLVLRKGDSLEHLRALIDQTGAKTILWNRRYEPWAIAQDTAIKAALTAQDVRADSFNARLLVEPWQIKTGSSDPYKVFTPFWKTARVFLDQHPHQTEPADRPPAAAVQAFKNVLPSDHLQAWGLLPTAPDWAGGLRATWVPGEAGAQSVLARFMAEAIDRYKSRRDFPAEPATSALSPHLAFGEISPRQLWQVVRTAMRDGTIPPADHKEAEHFITEIGWREFAYHLLYHFPQTPENALYSKYDDFPWRNDPQQLHCWQRGQTGIPIIDAAMRQLWETGWMHNRTRMIVASFLVKNLLLPWQEGARWFWDTLVDADLASNTLGWQWAAGCGADAAPYFRIFNPILQAAKFDPDGGYIKRYVPELQRLNGEALYTPWAAPALVLREAGVVLGQTYPAPIADLAATRARALAALATWKEG